MACARLKEDGYQNPRSAGAYHAVDGYEDTGANRARIWAQTGCVPPTSSQNALRVGINIKAFRAGVTHQGHAPLFCQLNRENVG